MNKTVILSLTLLGSAIVPSRRLPSRPSTSGEAAAVLNAAREALGGEKRISSIKTIVASGANAAASGRQPRSHPFEINIELPDKYVRTDEIPARESGPNSRGFNGDGLIQSGDAPGRGAGEAVRRRLHRRRRRRWGETGGAAGSLRTGWRRRRARAAQQDRRRIRPFPSNRISPS